MDTAQISHHTTHHTARQSTTQQQARHVLVGRIDEVSQPFIYELLCQGTSLHISIHIDVCDLKALVFQHGLHADNIGMNLTPRQGFDGSINDVSAIVADFEDARHGEAWS